VIEGINRPNILLPIPPPPRQNTALSRRARNGNVVCGEVLALVTSQQFQDGKLNCMYTRWKGRWTREQTHTVRRRANDRHAAAHDDIIGTSQSQTDNGLLLMSTVSFRPTTTTTRFYHHTAGRGEAAETAGKQKRTERRAANRS